jgi:hypothetical protein
MKLRQAVVWSEILAKPPGLSQRYTARWHNL